MMGYESLRAPLPAPPDYIYAFDGSDWRYYVSGYDEDDLRIVDDPASLEFERLSMKPIRASLAEDYGLFGAEEYETVERDPATGRFAPRWLWIECHDEDPDAQPFMGVRYKRG